MIYPASLTINELSLMVHLGYGAQERVEKQQIKLSIELYYSNQPIACVRDGEGFICYHELCEMFKKMVASGEFALIEYLGTELAKAMEGFLQAQAQKAGIDDVRYVLRLHKCFAPVEDLLGGTTYIYTNMPKGLI